MGLFDFLKPKADRDALAQIARGSRLSWNAYELSHGNKDKEAELRIEGLRSVRDVTFRSGISGKTRDLAKERLLDLANGVLGRAEAMIGIDRAFAARLVAIVSIDGPQDNAELKQYIEKFERQHNL